MRYTNCISFEDRNCYNVGLRNGLNTLPCIGYDRCSHYEVETPPVTSRVDVVGQNGNDGQVYLAEKIARAICGEALADQDWYGKKRWETHLAQALRVMEVLDE